MAQCFADQRVEVAAPRDAGQISTIVLFQLGQVLAVVIRIVKVVAHQPPRLAVHLRPLGRWVDLEGERLQVEPLFVEL